MSVATGMRSFLMKMSFLGNWRDSPSLFELFRPSRESTHCTGSGFAYDPFLSAAQGMADANLRLLQIGYRDRAD